MFFTARNNSPAAPHCGFSRDLTQVYFLSKGFSIQWMWHAVGHVERTWALGKKSCVKVQLGSSRESEFDLCEHVTTDHSEIMITCRKCDLAGGANEKVARRNKAWWQFPTNGRWFSFRDSPRCHLNTVAFTSQCWGQVVSIDLSKWAAN